MFNALKVALYSIGGVNSNLEGGLIGAFPALSKPGLLPPKRAYWDSYVSNGELNSTAFGSSFLT